MKTDGFVEHSSGQFNIDFVVAAFFDVRSVLPALSLQCRQDC